MKSAHVKFFAATALTLFFSPGLFAQTERDKGIEAYKTRNYVEAIRVLSGASKQKTYKSDGELWNYLGLAYISNNEPKNGRKAFEKAVKFTPQSSIYYANLAYAYLLERKPNKAQNEIKKALKLDSKNARAYYIRGTANLWEAKNDRAVADAEQSISMDSKFTAAYILHSDALLASFGEKWAGEEKSPQTDFGFLTRAADSLSNCLANCPKDDMMETVVERADSINAFTDYFKRKNSDKTAQPDNAAQPNRIPLNVISKPKAKYTDEARQQNEAGDVKMAIFFGADGRTKRILILKGLRYGLTEQALNAARQITFEPETIDGKPVSAVKMVIYSFDIY